MSPFFSLKLLAVNFSNRGGLDVLIASDISRRNRQTSTPFSFFGRVIS